MHKTSLLIFLFVLTTLFPSCHSKNGKGSGADGDGLVVGKVIRIVDGDKYHDYSGAKSASKFAANSASDFTAIGSTKNKNRFITKIPEPFLDFISKMHYFCSIIEINPDNELSGIQEQDVWTGLF